MKKTLKELEEMRGRHTELVTVYVPHGHNLMDTINQLNQEKSTAANIKSKSTKNNVLDALDKITQHLKLYRKTPEKGLAIFCGNVSPVEGKVDLKLWAFEPPEKLNVKLYWCDQVFVMDPLKELTREREIYGLIVLDANEANIGFLKGKEIMQVKHMDSTVPGKTIKGGMCLHEDTIVNNGKTSEIKKIKEGEDVMSYDFNYKKFVFSKVEVVQKRKADVVYKIVTDNGNEIVTTPEHVMFVKKTFSTVEVPAGDLSVGDRLLSINFDNLNELKPAKIVSKSVVKTTGHFFDLQVHGTSNFIANGILVHNSQMRYDRIREDALNDFFRKVAEAASNIFLEQKDLIGVLLGGPGPNKEVFFKEAYLNYQIQKKILGIKDVGYTGMTGLQELVKRSEDLIKESKYMKEREIMKKFFTEIQKSGNVVYGYDSVRKALDLGAVDVLLISENFTMFRVKLKSQCGASKEMDITDDKRKQLCDNCHDVMVMEEELDMSEILIKDAEKFGTKVEWVSVDTEEGRQFEKIGAIGGMLRFKISQ